MVKYNLSMVAFPILLRPALLAEFKIIRFEKGGEGNIAFLNIQFFYYLEYIQHTCLKVANSHLSPHYIGRQYKAKLTNY